MGNDGAVWERRGVGCEGCECSVLLNSTATVSL